MNPCKNQAFGINFYDDTKSSLLRLVSKKVKEPYSFVVTPNVDHLILFKENERFRYAYESAFCRVCDSRVLMPLLRSLKIDIPEVIPGSDLTVDLLVLSNSESWRVLIVGGSERELDVLKKKFPKIRFYMHVPPMGFINMPEAVDECIKFIQEHDSEIILYALGAPRQEILASYIDPTSRSGIGFCVGASISFASGEAKRAPIWMQHIGFEWFYRLVTEPKRLTGRYFKDFIFIVPAFFREKFKK